MHIYTYIHTYLHMFVYMYVVVVCRANVYSMYMYVYMYICRCLRIPPLPVDVMGDWRVGEVTPHTIWGGGEAVNTRDGTICMCIKIIKIYVCR